jgi:hypothetical protein
MLPLPQEENFNEFTSDQLPFFHSMRGVLESRYRRMREEKGAARRGSSAQLRPALLPISTQLCAALQQLHAAHYFLRLCNAQTDLLSRSCLNPSAQPWHTAILLPLLQQHHRDGAVMGEPRHRLQSIGGAFIGMAVLRMIQRNCRKPAQHSRSTLMDSILLRLAAGRVSAMVTALHRRALALRRRGLCVAAAKMFKQAIALGSLPSCADLADMLIDGREGLPSDCKTAFMLANHGAQLGCHHCQGVLSRCYLIAEDIFRASMKGFPRECIEKRFDRERLARASAAKGSRYGQFMLGMDPSLVRTDPTRAEALRTLSAEQGYEEAQFTKAALYMRDGDGHTKDVVQALQWYKRAAAQGLSLAL